MTGIAVALAADPEPQPHASGRCALCGVGRSTSWSTDAGVWWPDGTAGAVCSDCAGLVPVVSSDELLETRALAAMAGMLATPSLVAHERFGFRRASAVLEPHERHDPDATRWGYRPQQLAEVRAAAREALPELILDPSERAAGVERLLERRDRAAAAEVARKNAQTPGGRIRW